MNFLKNTLIIVTTVLSGSISAKPLESHAPSHAKCTYYAIAAGSSYLADLHYKRAITILGKSQLSYHYGVTAGYTKTMAILRNSSERQVAIQSYNALGCSDLLPSRL